MSNFSQGISAITEHKLFRIDSHCAFFTFYLSVIVISVYFVDCFFLCKCHIDLFEQKILVNYKSKHQIY